MRRIAALCASLLLPLMAHATEITNRPELGQEFEKLGITGTFVLYDVTADRMDVYNRDRANTPYSPASTFKIFNTLAGLESGAVRNVDEVFPYDGKPKFLKSWEKDMGLREAMKVSNLSVYQVLAKRIGPVRMQRYLDSVGYGNRNMGNVIDQFWVNGSLKISAVEQSRFLAKLAKRQLPFSMHALTQTREILQLERTANYTLYGKTGMAANTEPGTGWWVGWVEKENKIYTFALNIDLTDKDDISTRAKTGDLAKRLIVGRRALTVLGLL
ncbi:class D beta-lactamase [Chitinimonas sp. BJB300]|uniref:class D beta-lactamase n=1 Tax=Chitinimonas sp. BJB300 TaxID=1559339 RepID=UPI0013043CF4|nr:class D beta-lactamase [Chitinimonas sp. BJB300]